MGRDRRGKIFPDQSLYIGLNARGMEKLFELDELKLKLMLCIMKYLTEGRSVKGSSCNKSVLYNGEDFKAYIRKHGIPLTEGVVDLYLVDLSIEGFLVRKDVGEYEVNSLFYKKV